MNHWSSGQLPYSWNPKGITLDWSGSDNPTNFNKNKDKWDNVKISYEYNSSGFRTHELDGLLGQKVNLALGCSITEGIGLSINQVWPSLIEQQLTHPMLNLGSGGAATDTVARILTNVVTLFDLQTVFIMWPFVHRFETYMESGQIRTILPHNSKIEHQWAVTDSMSNQRFNQNQLIVNLLSERYGFSVKQSTAFDLLYQIVDKDTARDGMHPGPNMQLLLADMMLSS